MFDKYYDEELVKYYGLNPDPDFLFEGKELSDNEMLGLFFRKYPEFLVKDIKYRYHRGMEENQIELLQIKPFFDIILLDVPETLHYIERIIFWSNAGNYNDHNYHFTEEEPNQVRNRLLKKLAELTPFEAVEFLDRIESIIDDIDPDPFITEYPGTKYKGIAHDILGMITEFRMMYQYQEKMRLPKYTIGQRIMVFKELGLFEHLFEHYSFRDNTTTLSEILGPIFNENAGSIRRVIDAVYKEQSTSKNNPYRNKKNIVEIDNLFKSLKIRKLE